MKGIYIILFVIFGAGLVKAEDIPGVKLKTGDLLFQNLDCGELCDAIEAVTEGFDGRDFSHIGLVVIRNNMPYVIEAIGKDVHLTPLTTFISRSGKNKVYVGRVKPKYHNLAKKAVTNAMNNAGVPYDDEFICNNGKYYCSELIYDAFKAANADKPFFELQPMTFRQPGSDNYFPVWVRYYEELKKQIPEGQPGINPGGISRSDKIVILNK